MTHLVKFEGGPLDGQVVEVERLAEVFRVPVWDRDENYASDGTCAPSSSMNHRAVTYTLEYRVRHPDSAPRPVYVTEDTATREQFPLRLPEPPPDATLCRPSSDGSIRPVVRGRVYARPLPETEGAAVRSGVEFGVDWSQWADVGYISENSGSFGVELTHEQLTRLSREQIASVFGIPVEVLDGIDARTPQFVTREQAASALGLLLDDADMLGRGAQDAPVAMALANRYCEDCDVHWKGGEHCWSCGQPCKPTNRSPGIKDQHGFASWEQY